MTPGGTAHVVVTSWVASNSNKGKHEKKNEKYNWNAINTATFCDNGRGYDSASY